MELYIAAVHHFLASFATKMAKLAINLCISINVLPFMFNGTIALYLGQLANYMDDAAWGC
jgi:hypothetical protein